MSRYIASEFISNNLAKTTWRNNSRRVTWLTPNVNVSCFLNKNRIIQQPPRTCMRDWFSIIIQTLVNFHIFYPFFHLKQTIIDYDSIHRGMARNKDQFNIIKDRCISIIDKHNNNIFLLVSNSIIRMHRPPIGIETLERNNMEISLPSIM